MIQKHLSMYNNFNCHTYVSGKTLFKMLHFHYFKDSAPCFNIVSGVRCIYNDVKINHKCCEYSYTACHKKTSFSQSTMLIVHIWCCESWNDLSSEFVILPGKYSLTEPLSRLQTLENSDCLERIEHMGGQWRSGLYYRSCLRSFCGYSPFESVVI